MRVRIAAAFCVSVILLALPLPSGEQWANVGGPGGCAVYTLAANGSYLFAGTKLGAYVSKDYGRNWSPAGETGLAALGEALVSGILISKSDVYALTQQGLSLSTDRGAGWTSLKTGLPDGSGVSCLLEAGSTLYCGLSEGGVYRSMDRGAHWSPAGSGLPDDAPVINLVAVGEVLYAGCFLEGIFQSRDAGANWTPISMKLPIAHSDSFWNFASNGRELFAGTEDGFFVTEGGITSWTRLGTDWNVGHSSGFISSSGQNLLADISASFDDDRQFLSTDGGTTWRALQISNAPERIHARCVAASGSRLFVGTAGSGVFRSDDLGETWTRASTGLPSEARITAISELGPDVLAASGSWKRGKIYLRAKGGAGWTPAGSGLPAEVSLFCIEAVGKNLLAGSDRGIFVSRDRGRSWSVTRSGLPEKAQVHCFKLVGRRLFAGTSDGVFLSEDQGLSWSPIGSGLPGSVWTYCLETLGEALFAGCSKGIFVSRDSGETWIAVDVAPLGKIACHCLAANGKIIVAGVRLHEEEDFPVKNGVTIIEDDVVSEYAILVSRDDGLSWERVTEGLPEVFAVSCLGATETSFIAGIEFRQSGLGGLPLGLFLSTDGGKSWTSEWPGNWTATPINCLRPGKSGIYAGTEGAGVWRLPLAALGKTR